MSRIALGVAAAVALALSGGAWSKDKAPVCTFAEQPLDAPAEAPSETTRRSRIEVVATAPAAGEPVHPATVIGIDVEYHIADFVPGSYELVPNFAVLTFGLNKIVGDAGEGAHMLSQAHGRAHLCAPVRSLFREDDVRWPLRLHVSLHKRNGPQSSTIYAQSGHLEFPSPDLAPEVLERQKSAPSEDYFLALDAVFGFHEESAAAYHACVERFPDTRATLDAPWREWSGKNGALFARIDALQLQRYTEALQGTTRSPETRMDDARREYVDYMERQNDVVMRRRCAELRLTLSGEPREFVGRYLTVLDEQTNQQ